MSKFVVIAFLACLAFSYVTAGTRVQRQAKSECNSTILTNIDRCCDMPKLLAIEYVTTCFNTIKGMNILESQTTNCLVECVLKAQNVLTPTGAIDLKKCQSVFVTPTTINIWVPVINNAITTCAKQLASKKTSWATTSQTCNARPALFMSCMGHYLALECPGASTIPNTVDNCAEKKAHLENCDPYAGIN